MPTINTQINFSNPSDFTLIGASIASNILKLAVANAAQDILNNFSSSSGFTLDSAKAQITGGLLSQKTQRPTGATFGAQFASSINANWGGGVLTGTPTGGAVIAGGKLDLTGNAIKYVTFGGTSNVNNPQLGAVRMLFTPAYTGAPADNQNLFSVEKAAGDTTNAMWLTVDNGGMIHYYCFDSSNSLVVNAVFGSWTPTAGQEYEIELNYDLNTGAHRLFIDGVQFGSTQTDTGTRTSVIDVLQIGQFNTNTNGQNFSVRKFEVFSAVQHVANYTPGYVVPAFDYAASNVVFPSGNYNGPGPLVSLNSFAMTEVGSPRYLINGKYWTGSAWAASDGTYAQANPKATVIANLAAFSLVSAMDIVLTAVFTDSNVQSTLASYDLNYTGAFYSLLGSAIPVAVLDMSSFVSFACSPTTPASTSVGFIVSVDDVLKYWDGAAWSVSDGTIAQSSSAANINAHVASLGFADAEAVTVMVVLKTTDNTASPSLTSMTIGYDFAGLDPGADTCIVWDYIKDVSGNPEVGVSVNFNIKKTSKQYKEAQSNIIEAAVSVLTDANGYFECPLIKSSTYQGAGVYEFSVNAAGAGGAALINQLNQSPITFTVPDSSTARLSDLITGI